MFPLQLVLSFQVSHSFFSDKLNLSKVLISWSNSNEQFIHVLISTGNFHACGFQQPFLLYNFKSEFYCLVFQCPQNTTRKGLVLKGQSSQRRSLDFVPWPVLPTEEESWSLFLGKRSLESRVPGSEHSHRVCSMQLLRASDCTWKYRKVTSLYCLIQYSVIFHTVNYIIIHSYIVIWRRQWHPIPVLLPGKSHGQRSLEGCSPWGR